MMLQRDSRHDSELAYLLAIREEATVCGAAQIVDRHWPAILAELSNGGFLGEGQGYTLEDIMAACHLACEKLLCAVV